MTNTEKIFLSHDEDIPIQYKYSSLEAGNWIMVTLMVADTSFPPISVTGMKINISPIPRYKITYPGIGFLLNI